MKHTKGPWATLSGERNKTYIVNHTDQLSRVHIAQMLNAEDSKANAQLIASAPDLLEALEQLLMLIDLEDLEVVEIINKAIAKAKGEG